MYRSRRTGGISGNGDVFDLGKDLFGFLFILLAVFMLMAEAGSGKAGTKAPGEEDGNEARPSRTVLETGASSVTLPKDVCGRLELREGRLVVAYGADVYDPKMDIPRLKRDARLVKVSGPGEAPLWALYARAESPEAISLALYGAAMSELGKNNIEIRLVEEMQ